MQTNSAAGRLQLAAARRGLRLARSNHRRHTASCYCLRDISDATWVVGTLPSGELGFVKSSFSREVAAVWFPLEEIERVLAGWSEVLLGPDIRAAQLIRANRSLVRRIRR